MITPKAIKEFKQIYQEKYGEEISEDEARRLGVKLLALFEAVYKPIPKDES